MARIRKQQCTQTGDHATQKSFRLYHDQDADLIDWLAEYAKRYKQTDLIRLALYTLAGLDMPAELAELLPTQPVPYPPAAQPPPEPDRASEQFEQLFAEIDYQRQEANEQIAMLYQELTDEKHLASRQLEAMLVELVEIRQTIRQPVGVTAPDAAEVVSSGMDTSRPRPDRSRSAPETPPPLPEQPEIERSTGIDMSRPQPRPTARRTPISVPAPALDDVTDADLIALGKLMARSIKNAQPGRGRHRQE